MRRSWSRLLATCWALWFALITVGPGGFGACQEHPFGHEGGHGGHAVAPEAAPSSAPADWTADGHHAQMAHGHGTEGATQVPAAPAHQCTCLGACCMLAPLLMPAAPALLVSIESAPRQTPTPAYRRILAARRVFSQPYAIGPPAIAIS